uniref:Vacuolar protein sorting-associated protein 53 n=2 Tax=Tetraselmis sp. GSL018 TaxID=582737 RepID=A0A061RIS0_9CHLO
MDFRDSNLDDTSSPSSSVGQSGKEKVNSIPETLDHKSFCAVDFVNSLFPTKESLVELEPVIKELRRRVRVVDAEILTSVRKQSSTTTRSKQDLKDAQGAIQDLFRKIKEIKQKAEQSEVMVQEICRDIKKLDYAKKHLTHSITALRRLSMLVSATDQLQATAEARNYREAANLLEAVSQLSGHFSAFVQVPKVAELRGRFSTIKGSLKSYIFEDFKLLHMPNGDGANSPELLDRLRDACLVIDAMDPQVRDELVNTVCNKEMAVYTQIFTGTGQVAKLEKTERRYHWLTKMLREKEKVWDIFPKHWRVLRIVCMTFCSITRAQLSEILDHQAGNLDVQALLQALHRTIEFEQDLSRRFGSRGTEDSVGDGDSPGRKPERRGATASAASRSEFVGSISQCFEKHLTCYVDLEEKTLMGHVDDLIAAETWQVEEGHEQVLSSSTQLFAYIKKSLKRCTGLTKGQTLLQLYQAFQRVLRAYAGRLLARLPKTAAGATSGSASNSSTEWQIKLEKSEEPVVCLIANTCDYCYKTVGGLAESVANTIKSEFSMEVSCEPEQDEFSSVMTACLSVLVLGMETRLDEALRQMTRKAWDRTESVGDQSDYVNTITTILTEGGRSLSSRLSDNDYQFFCEKLAASFTGRFTDAILRCRKVSEMAAQQMLLDTQAVRAQLLDLPVIEQSATAPGSYAKFVSEEMGRAEKLLKVAGARQESVLQSFMTLMPEGTVADFGAILDIKGLSKSEKQSLVESFERQSGQQHDGGVSKTASGQLGFSNSAAGAGNVPAPSQLGGSNFTASITSRMAAAGVSARASAAGATHFSLQNLRMGASNFMASRSTGDTFDKAKTVFGKAKFSNFMGGFSRDSASNPRPSPGDT